VTLSGILEYLSRTIPGRDHIDVMWTCCRSPIGQKGMWSAEIKSPWAAYEIKTKKDGEDIQDPAASEEKFKIIRQIQADGTVTLVRASDRAMMLSRDTWVGISTPIAPGGVLRDGAADFLINRKLPD